METDVARRMGYDFSQSIGNKVSEVIFKTEIYEKRKYGGYLNNGKYWMQSKDCTFPSFLLLINLHSRHANQTATSVDHSACLSSFKEMVNFCSTFEEIVPFISVNDYKEQCGVIYHGCSLIGDKYGS